LKGSKYISLLLAVLLVFTGLAFPVTVNAAANYSGLNLHQQYYLRLLGSYARADYYETDILASVTLAQAIYEGGWGSYSLPIGGNNLFGIKAYSSWNGKVYNQNTSLLYNSYGDFLVSLGQIKSNETSAWRAHDSWAESVAVHSNLFLESSRYTAVVGEKDYAVAMQAIVDGGYCNDNGYVQQAIKVLETYGLTYYDDITPDEDGIVALVCDTERVRLEIGEEFPLNITYYPANKTPAVLTWKSDNPSVATVDQNGKVKAVAHGTAFITATLANGREACCIVYVDCNATIINENVYVRTSPSKTAANRNKIYRGCGVKVTSDEIFTDSEGNEFMAVTGYNKEGELVSGYVLADYVYLNKRNVTSITFVKDYADLTVGQTYKVPASVASIDAVDAVLSWESGDEAIATVDETGVVTAVAAGTTTITASAAGGAKATLTLTVGTAAKDHKGIITSSDGLRVRETADWNGSSLGTVPFLSEVTIHGEPQGYWYKVTGVTTRNKTVTGYVFCIYVKNLLDGVTATKSVANADLTVYEEANTQSLKVGALAAGDIVVVGEEADGWTYVIGTSADGETVYGYVKLDGSGEIGGTENPNNPSTPGEGGGADLIPAGAWYALITSDGTLNIRESTSTSSSVLGEIPGGERVIVSSLANGWYRVHYNGITGYISADYAVTLYEGKVVGIDAGSYLNVRQAPSASGAKIGELQNNEIVTVIGENTDGWYRLETDNLAGYASADYIQITGKLLADIPPSNDGFTVTNDNLVLESGVLTGVYADTKISDFKSNFTGNIRFVNKDGKALADIDCVATGTRIIATVNGLEKTVATVVVKGDVNGDGTITSRDYLLVKRTFFGTYSLENVYLKAALVSGKAELNVRDYLLLKRAYFGTYKIQ